MAQATTDKVLAPLHGKLPSLALCMKAFAESGTVGRIIVATRDKEQRERISTLARQCAVTLPLMYVQGGAERADSVLAALEAIPEEDGEALAFIHDGARPLLEAEDLRELCRLASENGAACAGRAVTDTIKMLPDANSAAPQMKDLPRARLRAMETPQVFPGKLIRNAYRKAIEEKQTVTDDAAAAALLGIHPVLYTMPHPNPKLTNAADIDYVNLLLSKRSGQVKAHDTPPFRIGHGYDIHRFAEKRRLVLGGVEIAHTRGLDGHSDADCLCHAIADAILGAAGLPDIGHFFPPGKAETKDMDSLDIVRGAVAKAAELGLKVGNIDASLIAEEPKIAKHVPMMKERLAPALGISPAMIGIKATTNEGIGGLGRAEGIAAHAVALLIAKHEPCQISK